MAAARICRSQAPPLTEQTRFAVLVQDAKSLQGSVVRKVPDERQFCSMGPNRDWKFLLALNASA